MSIISQTFNKDAVTEFDYPELDGFKVRVAYINRDELTKIRKHSLEYKFNRRTHQREEILDDDKFLEQYAEKAVKGWTGLKFKYLPSLYPADISSFNPEDEVEYSPTEALELLKLSVDFDRFITDTQDALNKFSKEDKEKEVKNSKTTSVKS